MLASSIYNIGIIRKILVCNFHFYMPGVHCSCTCFRSSHRRCSVRKGVLRNFAKFTGKHLYLSLFFKKVAGACNFVKKETLVQVFSCEFCEISKKSFSNRTPPGDYFCFFSNYILFPCYWRNCFYFLLVHHIHLPLIEVATGCVM